MKDKAIVCFRRLADGTVLGEIINEAGDVVESRNFGLMSEDYYKRVLALVEREHPDISNLPLIELIGN